MEVPTNNSVLYINNHFHKLFKKIVEKKGKNEPITVEVDWLNSQLVGDDRKICKNSCDVFVHYGKKYDAGFSLNALLSAYSRLKNDNYDIIADGIFDLLLSSQACNFGILNKPHPGIILINDSTTRMIYLSKKIEDIFSTYRKLGPKFLHPVLLMTLCSNENIYPEANNIWKTIIECGDDNLIREIISLRRTTSSSSCMLSNYMLITRFKKFKDIENLLLILSSVKYLCEHSLDPTTNLQILKNNQEIFLANPNCINLILCLIAEILQISHVTYIPKILSILNILVVEKKLGHPIVVYMVLDGLIQILAYPTMLPKDIKIVEELVNFIGCTNLSQNSFGSIENFKNDFINIDSNLTNAYDVCKLIESNKLCLTDDFRLKRNFRKKLFWKRNHLILRGYIHSNELKNVDTEWNTVLLNLIEISKSDDVLKSSLVMPLLFELSQSFNPKIKISILQNLPDVGSSTEIFSTIKALSTGMIRSMSIILHFKLWKNEPRVYPFLHKALVEKSVHDNEDTNLSIIRAAIIKEICDLKPHHGSDLVTIISEILNHSLESKTEEVAAALAIDAITVLCQNHIISIMSTWKAINMTTRYEKRPRVIKSLCNFLSTVPQFKRNNLEYETFEKDIVNRIFYMIQWGDAWTIKCALNAFKSWNYDLLTLDMIPDVYRENIALPEAPNNMEVSILDLEVNGECYVQLLTKINRQALQTAGELVSHFMKQEINEYRSGHYIVKEGQAEPINYKNLPKQSIVKAITHFVIQQATTKKSEKIVDETILVEALNILSQKYSRPLPPLNWSFLHELIHKGTEVRAKSMALAAKQSIISGTAKRLIENFLINIDDSSDEDIEIALDLLVDLCNGASSEILKLFFERISTCRCENFNEKIFKLLSHEKDVTNHENLVLVVFAAINRGLSLSSALPHNIIRAIPSNILNAIHLSSENKIKYRCEILKQNPHVENSVAWINELLLDQLSKNEHRELLSTSFVELLIETDCFPTKKWLNEFLILVQNKTIEKGTIDEEGLKFLLDIFITAIICMSGYFVVVEFNQQISEKSYQLFAQSLHLFSSQDTNADVAGNIFEFMIFALNQSTTSDEIKTLFRNSIMLCKNHFYFRKSKPWQNFLEIIISCS